jgi:hypothetical protein
MSMDRNRNVYVGHRYVPKIAGEWDKQETYEGLTIVTYQGTSYTSKKHVPVGIDILNEEYWVVTGNYNAQVETYRQEVKDMKEEVSLKPSKEYVDTKLEEIAVSVNVYSSLQAAIESQDNNDLLFPAGIYTINTPIKAVSGTARKWISSGKVIFNYTGEANDIMLDVELNGNDLEIEGNFLFEGNNKARQGFQITNDVPSMLQAVTLKVNKVTSRNMFSTTTGKTAGGVAVRGAFDLVHIIDSSAKNISRAEGVGIPGSQGSDGITVSHYGSRAYAKQIIIDNPVIDTIISQEADDSPDNVDCDGIKVFAPVVGGNVVESIALINGGTFTDCRGRSVKSEMGYTHVDKPTFIRKNIKGIQNGSEIDFQYGNGKVTNWKAYYDPLGNGGSPLGSSWSLFHGGNNGRSSGSKVFTSIGEGTVFNNIPNSEPITYFITIGSSASVKQAYLSIDKVNHFGKGRIARVVRGALSNVEMLSIKDSYFSWIMTSLVNSTDTASIKMDISNVVQGNSNVTVPLFQGNGYPIINAQMVTGFKDNLQSDRNLQSGNTVRTNKIMEASSDVSSTALAFETRLIQPTETVTYKQRSTYSIVLLTTNVNRGFAIFAISGTNIYPLAETSTPLVAFGQGSNPDEADKFNVWVDSLGVIKVKNNISSERLVKITTIG